MLENAHSSAVEYLSKPEVKLNEEEYKAIVKFVYDKLGINLSGDKRTLLTARLHKIMREYNLPSFTAYYNMLQKDMSGRLVAELADAVSTNHSYMWREAGHFEYLKKKILPELKRNLMAKHSNDIRIWSAGCSTGDEAYNITMIMKEFFGYEYNNWQGGVLATDISEKVLRKAIKGIYHNEKVKEMPPDLLRKYFKRVDELHYQLSEQIRKEVTCRILNLMSPTFPFKKKFHAIFCRNVMIYFEEETRIELVNKFYNCLEPGGYFFVGHSETLKKYHGKFDVVEAAVYKKIG